jgi:hypothetical protein
MIKILWFLKRSERLTLQEFRDWWLAHAQDVAVAKHPHVLRYVVNIRDRDVDGLAGATADDPVWDGVAEQWFADEAAVHAAYAALGETRADTLGATSRFSRLIVSEHEIALPGEPL